MMEMPIINMGIRESVLWNHRVSDGDVSFRSYSVLMDEK